MAHRLTKPGFDPLLTASLGAATIRNMIDNFGFREEIHEAIVVTAPEASISGEIMAPGGSRFNFVAGPGTPGFDPIDPLMIPGGVPSTVNWPELIRTTIDSFFGRQDSTGQFQIPIPGGINLPIPGAPGGPPLLPAVGGLRTGGRTPFIRMPNGLPGCPTGYHPEKSGQPYCVRNRRMNPLNPRALSRATRRVGGFARAVKRARTLKKICKTL